MIDCEFAVCRTGTIPERVIGTDVGYVGHALLFDEIPLAGQ
jgi:hypothetical protein